MHEYSVDVHEESVESSGEQWKPWASTRRGWAHTTTAPVEFGNHSQSILVKLKDFIKRYSWLMPQEKNQTQQEATVSSSQAKEKLSTHLNQVSENSRLINIHTLLLL